MNDLERNRVDEICSLHTEIAGYCRMALDKAIRIGELLAEQKASLPHGEFGRWIQEHLPFSDRTVRNYMKLHECRDRLKTETISDLSEAYGLLRQPQLPAPDVSSKETATKGKSLLEQMQQLAERNIDLQVEMGQAMLAINELLTPAPGHITVGLADNDTVFEIEAGFLTVHKRTSQPERWRSHRYRADDLWWTLDKHVGIGRVGAVWQAAKIELTEDEVRQIDECLAQDCDFWDTIRQVVESRARSMADDTNFVAAARALYDKLMRVWDKLYEAAAEWTGYKVPVLVDSGDVARE